MKQPKDSYSPLLLVLTTAVFLFSARMALAGVDAWLDTNKINIGESVQLTIKSDRKTEAEPDITPVEKYFDILGSSSSTSINLANGSLSSSTTWYYTLSPNKKGKLIIPPINVGGEHTPELLLEVADAGTAPADTGRNIFIETSCAPENPFVQQQVICTVRLYSAQEITEGSLTDPKAGNAIIRRLGKDKSFNRIINNRRYRVIERRYAVFPQESGTMTITPPVFQGSVLIPRARGGRDPLSSLLNRDPFFSRGLPGFSGTTKHVSIRGTQATFDVNPRPANFSGGYWLPAAALTLSQKWEPESTEIRQGEPITRTITITAKCLMAEQLPDLTLETVAGCSIYPDRADLNNSEHSTGITGSRTQKIAFIPESAGTIKLPPVKLRWWNTTSGKAETVTLPGREINVVPEGGSGKGNNQPPMPGSDTAGEKTSEDKQKIPPTAVPVSAAADAADRTPEAACFWMWTAVALGVTWLITLWFLLQEKRKSRRDLGNMARKTIPEKKNMALIKQLRKEFTDACRNNDAAGAKNALLKWASVIWPENPPAGLMELARRISDDETTRELTTLNRVLYDHSAQEWQQGARLAELIRDLHRQKNHVYSTSLSSYTLPPLYPGRR